MLHTSFLNRSKHYGRKQYSTKTNQSTKEKTPKEESKILMVTMGLLFTLEFLSYQFTTDSYYAYILWSGNLSTVKVILITTVLTFFKKTIYAKYLIILSLFAIVDCVLIFSLLIPENYNIIVQVKGITDRLYRLAEIITLLAMVNNDSFLSRGSLYNSIHRVRSKFRTYRFFMG